MENETNVKTKEFTTKYSSEDINKFVDEFEITKWAEIIYRTMDQVEKYYNAENKLMKEITENDNNLLLTVIKSRAGACDIGMPMDEFLRLNKLVEESKNLNAFESAKNSVKYWLKFFNQFI